ncbi:ATP-grasp domain-containing protein [Streptomyces natalensis]|uniref:Siderophore biosynthesis protein n=1 Tax=Streptomyces natalensis ATCC 27448 TaxID=1240678 RepID=A0A0D7CM13_9ACTN|nr:ATP-grasp domain-containing protein [Streptomyces natalensis]KIZ17131.1 siderophore biosynthesis protein [Streptomyces natalensis ATCC 27448]
MRMYLLALNPTDSVTEGFLPAAARLGVEVTILTDQPEAHRSDVPRGTEVLECDVRDFRAVITCVAGRRPADAIFTNSDHLQVQAALAADYFGLPGKDWRAALCAKNKAEMRRRLAVAGVDTVRTVELEPGQDPSVLAAAELPYPCVIKPREGVASEDVMLVDGPGELVVCAKEIQTRRPEVALVAEEFLPGQLYTLETLGDGRLRHVLGGFRTAVSAPPTFIETGLEFVAAHPQSITDQVLAQLDALGVGFGACHTEFVVHEGRARLIEVNYRVIGDQCDLLLAHVLGIPLFELILRAHLGEPLPADLGARHGGAARVEYALADRAGTLVSAPGAVDRTVDGVRLAYRPLRAVGSEEPHYRTNRDYIGVVRAFGTEHGAVVRAVEGFFATERWEIA